MKGVYVCGSSGECIYQSVEERKLTLENVMAVAKGKLTVIAHVCNNTKDSVELAKTRPEPWGGCHCRHSSDLFRLPEYAIAQY